MQLSKGEHMFVKHNITRDVDATIFYIKALKPFVLIAIPKKRTPLRAKLKFSSIVWPEIRPARATKGA
jgi:hypothetical protein